MLKFVLAATVALPLALAAAGTASAATIHALTADNKMLAFDSETRAIARTVAVTGIDGTLIGIDIRPMDGKLYAVSDKNVIYTIDPMTGAATKVSQLDKPFQHGGKALVDFNPQADRLRLIGVNGVSFRVNVETGAVIVDGSLKYGEKDANAAKKPMVTMGAYTNAMPKAKGTELFNIDTTTGTLNLQSPPNDGVQQTRAKTSVAFGKTASIDIVLDANEDNVAYVLDGTALYTLNLKDGMAKKHGDIAGLPAVIDIAVAPVKK